MEGIRNIERVYKASQKLLIHKREPSWFVACLHIDLLHQQFSRPSGAPQSILHFTTSPLLLSLHISSAILSLTSF